MGGEVFSQDKSLSPLPRQEISIDPDKVPGVLFSLEKIVGAQSARFNSLIKKATNNPASISKIDSSKKIEIEPTFIRSMLIHSEPSYIALARQSKCSFYATLENDLLRGPNGVPDSIPIMATIKEKETPELLSIDRNNFIDIVYKKECAANRDYASLFEKNNLKKTIDSFTFSVPQSEKQCHNLLNEWASNSYLPYLCGIHEKIQDGERAELQLSQTPASELLTRRIFGSRIKARDEINNLTSIFQRSYISSLCQGLDNKQKFCAPFLTDEIWPKIIAGEKPAWLIDRRCQELIGKKTISGQDLVNCAGRFKKQKSLCSNLGSKTYPALFPKPDCTELSDALLASKLITRYRDCPGNLDNGTITNGFRLWSHFLATDNQVSSAQCAQVPALAYATESLKVDPKEGWPLSICFKDRASESRECLSYVPGPSQTSSLSENVIIKKILVNNFEMASDSDCKIIQGSNYNPSLLEFKNGCFIIYQDNICTLSNCDRKIILNQKEITGLEFIGDPLFSYFSDSLAQTKSTLQSLLRETLKIESKEIRNLTELTFYLKNLKSAIVHGIGCAEEILPSFFRRMYFNQCTPLAFIIDGISDRGNGDDVVIRTTVDDIHSPRVIPWNYIFNSVSAFQTQHLLKTWTLYGIKN